MTDKEKIREEVERLMNELIQEKKKGFGSDADDACILELQNVLTYIDSLQEEPVSEDYEKALNSVAITFLQEQQIVPNFYADIIMKAVKRGANWQKQQLMKNVVLETEVLRDSDGDGVDTPYESWLTLANTEIPELPESLGLKECDKVKIVIVKSK